MKILVTGGAGFIGTNFIKYIMDRHKDDEVLCVDKLTYAGNRGNLAEFENDSRFEFCKADICDKDKIEKIFRGYAPDCVINFAAESHVDRSLVSPSAFIETNVVGTQILLDAVNKYQIKRFHQVSTDEVYGDLPLDRPELKFNEESMLKPSSPYSASKAAADLLVLAYHRSFKTPVTVSRCSNNYGPYQHFEKLIPHMISLALCGKPLTVYGDGKNVRDWIYVDDHCRAIDMIIRGGKSGEVYNVGGGNEISNIGLVRMILSLLKKPEALIEYVADRPGHDRRYAINSDKLSRSLGYSPSVEFSDGLCKTVEWYVKNSALLNKTSRV